MNATAEAQWRSPLTELQSPKAALRLPTNRFVDPQCASRVFYYDGRIHAFPSLSLRPVERKDDARSRRQVCCRQVGGVEAKACVHGFGVVSCAPTVKAPVHQRMKAGLLSFRGDFSEG